jgi:hypothetical protein
MLKPFNLKENAMNKYIEIDLHSNNSVVVLTDEVDQIIFLKNLAN